MNARTDELLKSFYTFILHTLEKIKTKLNQLRYLHTNNLTAFYFSTSIFPYYCCLLALCWVCFSCTPWQNKILFLRAIYVLQEKLLQLKLAIMHRKTFVINFTTIFIVVSVLY